MILACADCKRTMMRMNKAKRRQNYLTMSNIRMTFIAITIIKHIQMRCMDRRLFTMCVSICLGVGIIMLATSERNDSGNH